MFSDDKGLFQLQTETVLVQQPDGIVAQDVQKGIVGQVASKSPADPRTVMVDLADMLAVPFLKKYAALIIGMDHIGFPPALGFVHEFRQGMISKRIQAQVHPHMASHALDERDLLGL